MADDGAAACAGKTFEHHPDWVFEPVSGAHGWRCPACGASGMIADMAERLAPLTVRLHALQSVSLGQDAVLLLPSDAPPGVIGQFMGCDIIRVPGISGPMVAIPAAA